MKTPRSVNIALVEIGTNSTKFVVARVFQPTAPEPTPPSFEVLSFSRVTNRIGEDLTNTGRIGRAKLEDTATAIDNFTSKLERRQIDHRFAFCTYAFRSASNARVAARRLERSLGCPLRILSGRDEARLAYESAKHRLALTKPVTVVIDVGGGSTEFVLARKGRIRSARSLRLGALYLTERFVQTDPIENTEFEKLRGHVERSASSVLTTGTAWRPRDVDLVVSGGTGTTLAAMIKHDGRVSSRRRAEDGVIKAIDVRRILEHCRTLTLRERKKLPGLEPGRADIIVAGLTVVSSFLETSRKRVLRVNWGGVREGALLEIIRNGFRW